MWNNSLIGWRSKKQSVVSKSTAAAEIIAAGIASDVLEWARLIVEEIGLNYEHKPVIYEDNKATISLATEAEIHKVRQLAKHFYGLQHYLMHGHMVMEYCPTQKMIADMFTKALGKNQLGALKKGLGLIDNLYQGECHEVIQTV